MKRLIRLFWCLVFAALMMAWLIYGASEYMRSLAR